MVVTWVWRLLSSSVVHTGYTVAPTILLTILFIVSTAARGIDREIMLGIGSTSLLSSGGGDGDGGGDGGVAGLHAGPGGDDARHVGIEHRALGQISGLAE